MTMTEAQAGKCQSGAALACEGTGVRMTLPESMLPNQDREMMVQCRACYEASLAAYNRKLEAAR